MWQKFREQTGAALTRRKEYREKKEIRGKAAKRDGDGIPRASARLWLKSRSGWLCLAGPFARPEADQYKTVSLCLASFNYPFQILNIASIRAFRCLHCAHKTRTEWHCAPNEVGVVLEANSLRLIVLGPCSFFRPLFCPHRYPALHVHPSCIQPLVSTAQLLCSITGDVL